jgi:hypothetical protein
MHKLPLLLSFLNSIAVVVHPTAVFLRLFWTESNLGGCQPPAILPKARSFLPTRLF